MCAIVRFTGDFAHHPPRSIRLAHPVGRFGYFWVRSARSRIPLLAFLCRLAFRPTRYGLLSWPSLAYYGSVWRDSAFPLSGNVRICPLPGRSLLPPPVISRSWPGLAGSGRISRTIVSIFLFFGPAFPSDQSLASSLFPFPPTLNRHFLRCHGLRRSCVARVPSVSSKSPSSLFSFFLRFVNPIASGALASSGQ
jgi:hypothetical protein